MNTYRLMDHIWTKKSLIYFVAFLLVCQATITEAWDNDFELYDLVEEVNQNFYEVMGLQQDASSNDIKKAYRRLSLQLHPDKNKEEDADVKFRQLVGIYEVLKDDEKRMKYNDILINGMPSWRQPVYYYRRVKKMSLVELTIFLFLISTGAQYLFAWSMYFEKKFELEEVLTSRFKRRERKSRKSKNTEGADESLKEVLDQLPKPKCQDLLPFKLCNLLIFIILSIPKSYQCWQSFWLDFTSKKNCESEEEEDLSTTEEKFRKPKRKKIFQLPDLSSGCLLESVDEPLSHEMENSSKSEESYLQLEKDSAKPKTWTQEDYIALIKAINKFPGGTTNRWEKIAEAMNCSIQEAVKASKNISCVHHLTVPASTQGITGSISEVPNSKLNINFESCETTELKEDVPKYVENQNETNRRHKNKIVKDPGRTLMIKEQLPVKASSADNASENTLANKLYVADENWNQIQQKALELALTQFPKGTEERWEKIANCVGGKTKEECMLRYKHLVEIVKQKKQSIPK